MSRITWSNKVGGLPICDNARSVPRKPVVWWGTVWLRLPNGQKAEIGWRSKGPITRSQAQEVMAAMLDDLIKDEGEDAAVDSGFTLECR